jgi:hypothetical protein
MSGVYKLKTDQGTCYIGADLSQASDNVRVYFGDDPFHEGKRDGEGLAWDRLPYQTGDVQHRPERLMKLVAKHCNLGRVLGFEWIEE